MGRLERETDARWEAEIRCRIGGQLAEMQGKLKWLEGMALDMQRQLLALEMGASRPPSDS